MQPLDYQKTRDARAWRLYVRRAIVVSCLVFAGLPTVFAILFWCIHAYQSWTDTVPPVPLTAGLMAETLTKLSLICWAAVGIGWWLTTSLLRRRADLRFDEEGEPRP